MTFLPRCLEKLALRMAADNQRDARAGLRVSEFDGGPEVGACWRVEVSPA
jgi:hypothetical protein